MLRKTEAEEQKNDDYLPSVSTSRATLRASEVAMSVLAAVTARMMELGLEMYLKISSLIRISMSLGWSPTGTCHNKH